MTLETIAQVVTIYGGLHLLVAAVSPNKSAAANAFSAVLFTAAVMVATAREPASRLAPTESKAPVLNTGALRPG